MSKELYIYDIEVKLSVGVNGDDCNVVLKSGIIDDCGNIEELDISITNPVAPFDIAPFNMSKIEKYVNKYLDFEYKGEDIKFMGMYSSNDKDKINKISKIIEDMSII